jgi:hypothetical protein
MKEGNVMTQKYNPNETPSCEVPPPNQKNENFREETAAEYAVNPGMYREPEDTVENNEQEEGTGAGKGIGALGIALSIVSLFFLPLLFSITGIILGAVAVKRDQKGIGYTAIVIGAFALIVSMFFAPFVT